MSTQLQLVVHHPPSTALTIATTLTPHEIARLTANEEARFAPNTRTAQKSDLAQFTHFIAERYPELPHPKQAGVEAVLAFIVRQQDAGLKATTIRRRLSSLKHVLTNVTSQEWKRIADNVGGAKRQEATGGQLGKDPLLATDLQKLLDVRITRKFYTETHAVQDRALLMFMWYSACRRSEVSSLRWSDLRFSDDGVLITIRKSKGDQEGKGKTIAIHSRAERCPVEALLKWRVTMQTIDPNRHVFVHIPERKELHFNYREPQSMLPDFIYDVVKDRCKLAGLDPARFGCHSFRSGLATQAAINGVDLVEIRDQLRHACVSTSIRYVKNRDLLKPTGITSRV